MIVDAQVAFFGGLAHAHIELVNAVGLGQIIIGAVLHGFDGGFDRALTGEHDYFRRVRSFMNAAQEFHAVHARHVDVAQQHVYVAFFELAQRGFTIGRGLYAITQALQFLLQHQSQVGLVFGYQ